MGYLISTQLGKIAIIFSTVLALCCSGYVIAGLIVAGLGYAWTKT